MNDFKEMNTQQLKNIMTFTSALADQIEKEKQVNFGSLETTNASLAQVEQSSKAYAAKRKRQAGFSDVEIQDDEADEDGSVRDRIRDWYRRTRKIVKG
jgi:hypothetical protein